jgi:hypothetical protein
VEEIYIVGAQLEIGLFKLEQHLLKESEEWNSEM